MMLFLGRRGKIKMQIEKFIEKLKRIEAEEEGVTLPYNIIIKMKFLQQVLYVRHLRELLEDVLRADDD